jgi:hypothetical protein
MKTLNDQVTSPKIRQLYSKVIAKAIEVISELAELVRHESVTHLETLYQVCKIATLYQNDELKFLSLIDGVRNKFDSNFLSYLRYAIKDEENSLATKGIDYVKSPSKWLNILRIVYNAVLHDLEVRFDRLLDPLVQIVRFTQPEIQSKLFHKFVSRVPPVDLPYLKTLSQNLVDSIIADSTNSKFLPNVLQLQLDIESCLADEMIRKRINDFRQEARAQGFELEFFKANYKNIESSINL